MKTSKLIKAFKTFLSWDKNEVKENAVEINAMIKKLYEKRAKIEEKIRNCSDKNDEEKLKEKLKAVKKLIKKAKKEFI